jgi:hypothetical protein
MEATQRMIQLREIEEKQEEEKEERKKKKKKNSLW